MSKEIGNVPDDTTFYCDHMLVSLRRKFANAADFGVREHTSPHVSPSDVRKCYNVRKFLVRASITYEGTKNGNHTKFKW